MKRWLRSLLDPLYRWLTSYMGWSGLILYGGGKSDPPPAPDYTSAAQATAAGNKENLTAQTWANRPNQNTPWGTQTWDTSVQTDPATGQPVTSWTQNTNVSPALQGALNAQLGLQTGRSELAGSMLPAVTQSMQTPFDWSTLPASGTAPTVQSLSPTTTAWNPDQFAAQRNQEIQAANDSMQPQFQRDMDATVTRLRNQGISEGSDAWNAEMDRLNNEQKQQQWNAIQTANQNQASLNSQMLANQGQAFGQSAQAGAQTFGQQSSLADIMSRLRQQGISEASQNRTMSLNEMNALLNGQQVTPSAMPSFSGAGYTSGPNYSQAAAQTGAANNAIWQMNNANQQAGLSGLGTLGSIAMYALM